MERRLVRGKTVDEQLNSIDLILRQYRRRLSKKVVGIIPPVPIIHSVMNPGPDGRIFAGIIPFSGVLTTFCISIGQYANKRSGAKINIISNHRDGTGETKEISCKNPVHVFVADIRIAVGDRFRIMEQVPGSCFDVLIGALIHPEMSQSAVNSQMLQQVLSLEELEDAEEEKS